MRPLGARKTRRGYTCWPAKGGRSAEKQAALAQEYTRHGRRVVTPDEVADRRERVLAIKF